ncbi:hypothetical protein JCM3774_000902 [Rhodotorula dairenensis]
MYGVGPDWAYDAGPPTDQFGPGLEQDDWWFRGPKARSLTPQDGACNYAFSSNGYDPSVPCSLLDACATGAGPYHTGDPDAPEIDTSLVSGCALATANVDDISKVPARMRKCTGSKCICGWFWLATNGTANFYMTAFDCSVTGSPADATPHAPPQDPVFCKNDPSSCTRGSKRPIYAYNNPTSVPWIGNDDRAGYHASWSFGTNGAQNDIFLSSAEHSAVNRTVSR